MRLLLLIALASVPSVAVADDSPIHPGQLSEQFDAYYKLAGCAAAGEVCLALDVHHTNNPTLAPDGRMAILFENLRSIWPGVPAGEPWIVVGGPGAGCNVVGGGLTSAAWITAAAAGGCEFFPVADPLRQPGSIAVTLLTNPQSVDVGVYQVTMTTVPEPGTLGLAGTGVIAILLATRGRKRRHRLPDGGLVPRTSR